MENLSFERYTFKTRLKRMLSVDFRRMLRWPLFYILVAACFVMPILILVMVTMMDGMVTVDPQTGVESVMEGFDNVWQIIGSVSDTSMMGGDAAGGAAAMDMDITSMCNINMLYFFISVLVCVFVSDDFRSGYAKNLFTVRSRKSDYVVSKTFVCFFGGALMILAFFGGAMIGGAIAGLPFDMEGFGAGNLGMCILSKVLLVAVFIPIYLVMAVVAKQRLWMSILLSMMVGMFLFMMIPMMTPLNATPMHALLCVAGGAMFGFGIGAISNQVLRKTSLV